MVHSSEKLKRTQEAMEYSKRLLKIYTTEFNKKKIDINELLTGYAVYIKSQIENKYFSDALKTFEKMKIYSLNSPNPRDVETVLEEKLNDYMSQLNILNQLNPKEAGDFMRAQLPSLRTTEFRVGELCEQKSMVFAGLSQGYLY